MRTLVLAAMGLSLLPTLASATDFHSCASQLRDVEEAASTAATAADEAADAQETLQQAKDDYNQCREYPEVYDLLEDGCSSQREEYESAREIYNDAIDEYNSAIRSFSAELRAVRISCS